MIAASRRFNTAILALGLIILGFNAYALSQDPDYWLPWFVVVIWAVVLVPQAIWRLAR